MGDEIVLERILNGDEDPKDLPLALLQRITNNFSEDRKIGQGGFGVVYKGVLRNGIIVAVKRIDVNVITIDDVSFRREINSLLKINHQNVVRFLGFCSNTHHLSIQEAGSSAVDFVNVRERLLCLEYISNGSLDKHITDELRGLEWETRYDIITGICKGLCHLKENKIIHMDLKPANILLDDHMIQKITDFGLSRPDENSHTMGQRFGTRGYFAPEYDNFGKTSFECDIYSLGIIIIELVTGFKGTPDKDNVLERWKCRESNPPMTLLQYQQVTSCIEIEVRCREQEPKDRPHICDIISILSILSESESTDGHTAGQAKNRNIAESAFGKEKLGSSKKAEASLVRYMDINSSAQGPCTGQTEQYNLHPLQSFSRHYPTNKTYLGEESRAVDVTRGAMGSLLDKLGKLVKEDYNLDRSMKRDIESFSEGLTKIHKDLSKLEKLDLVKIWVDEVRELSYNIEDKVDSFLVHVEPDSTSSGFRELAHEGLNFLENDMTTYRQIGVVIRDIKSQVQAVTDKGKKYNIDVKNVVANATAKSTIDLRFLAIYVDEDQLIGMEEPRDVIIRLLEEDGDVSKLKIVSIVGMGGLGKTTLAKAVYDKLQAQYHHRAFVPVGQNPNVEKVLKNILFAFGKDFNAAHLELFQLINELKELLKKERYFIVIDDIWDSEEWDLITSAFPRNNHGSRVITTTRIERVARACCKHESKYVYRMKPLSEEDSRRLFFRRIFDPEKDCPDAPRKEEISKYILKKCGGMPLAINSIASLLAGEEESTWEYIWKSLCFVTEGDDLAKMKQILDLSYIHLPDHLKTCLLYVCMYPEDREIDKNDLLRQWVAEGFVVSKNGRLDVEEVAEKYFKELISMCMIQPGRIDHYSNEVLSCRVHDIILDLMRSKSSDENFSHVSDGSKTWAHGEIRRIWVHCNDKEDSAIFETIKGSLSHARSALFHYVSPVPYLPVFKYVRVLHIWLQNQDLDVTGITRLFLLRYLKIDLSFEELKLPDQIGELQHLETIDLWGCRLENYPSDIVRLPWLSHLGYGVLPDGVERLQSLRTLEGVHLYESSAENIKGLGKLTNLRKLQIFLAENTTAVCMDALHSSISMLSASLRIRTLEIRTILNPLFVQDVPRRWSSTTLFPDGSAIRELDQSCSCRFERCPGWISQLSNLHKFSVTVREVADCLNLVSGLSSLAIFQLEICGVKPEEQKEESVVIPGGGAFKALKELNFWCPKAALTFELGAMPKLEKLVMCFRYEMTPQFLPVGIQHLPAPTLKEIWLHLEEGSMEVKVKAMLQKAMLQKAFKWQRYLDSDKCRDKQTEHDRKLKAMLQKAFKQHHLGADIYVYFEGYREEYLEEYSDEEYCEEDDNKEEDDEEYYFTDEDDEIVDDEEYYSTEEDEEAAYQVNGSPTLAQVQANIRQLVQLIETHQDSGRKSINTDAPPMVDMLAHPAVRLPGWQIRRDQAFVISDALQLSFTARQRRWPLHLTPYSSPNRAERMANFHFDINNDLSVERSI